MSGVMVGKMSVGFVALLKGQEPYSVRNRGPVPRIDPEEGLPIGTLDIAWVDPKRKNLYNWSKGLKWYERLHAHATMNSARRNAKCKRPFEPKDELDFVLDAAYCPNLEVISEKGDPYLQIETALGENMNNLLQKRYLEMQRKRQSYFSRKGSENRPKFLPLIKQEKPTWRLLRNRMDVLPSKTVAPRAYAVVISNGGVERRENIYHVKLGIAADHSPQTNAGYSRTPSGAFYSI